MISTPQLSPAARAWEAEHIAAAARSDAFLRALEKARREKIMRAARQCAPEPDYAI